MPTSTPPTYLLSIDLYQKLNWKIFETLPSNSVTRFGDLLDFGQLFKAFGFNYFAQIAHIFRQIL